MSNVLDLFLLVQSLLILATNVGQDFVLFLVTFLTSVSAFWIFKGKQYFTVTYFMERGLHLNIHHRNCTFTQKFHTRKLGENTVLYTAMKTSYIEAPCFKSKDL